MKIIFFIVDKTKLEFTPLQYCEYISLVIRSTKKKKKRERESEVDRDRRKLFQGTKRWDETKASLKRVRE